MHTSYCSKSSALTPYILIELPLWYSRRPEVYCQYLIQWGHFQTVVNTLSFKYGNLTMKRTFRFHLSAGVRKENEDWK